MIGFYQGVGQQSVCVDLQLKISAAPEFEHIDAFLALLLGEDYTEPSRPVGKSILVDETALRYARRVLYLTTGIQRLAQVPVFADARIVGLRRGPDNDGSFDLKVLLPQLDFFPLRFLQAALSVSNRLVSLASEGPLDPVKQDSAYQLVFQNIIEPIRRFARSGVSTMPILRAAYSQAIPFWHLGHGAYLLGMGANGRVIDKSSTDLDSALGAQAANRKDWTAQLLRVAGLPAPSHVLISSADEAHKAAETLGWPIVVKPADRERSEGVTTDLWDHSALKRAFESARKFSKKILVERHVPGVCFRLMVANRKFLYAVERRPRSLLGNGSDSIHQLLLAEQQSNARLPPWFRKKALTIDEEMAAVIRAQGFDLESVPDAGVRVGLKSVESTEWGETTFDVTGRVAAENIDIVERAAAALGLNNAGVDMITTDISRPWSEVGAVINEVNFCPHFGGTAAARERMPYYVQSLAPNKGQVPVEVFIGNAMALEAARKRQLSLIGRGVQACLTSHQASYGPSGAPRQFAGDNTLSGRCLALLLDKAAEAIILVIQTDELLESGMPVNRVSAMNVVNQELSAKDDPGQQVAPEDVNRIVTLIAGFQDRPS